VGAIPVFYRDEMLANSDSRSPSAGQAGKGAALTHSHPEGIKGAQATAAAVFAARPAH
jgi:ADP-ribosylglycohydrolase